MSRSKPVSRRSALLTTVKAAGFLLLPMAKRSTEARILIVTGGSAGAMGATLGMEENRQAWRLLRRPVAMEAIDAVDGPGRAVRHSACVVTTVDDAAYGAWNEALASSDVLHVDGAAHMRDETCVSSRFVVGRSDDDRSKLLWHSSLERYGARQLNDRFRTRFSREMDSSEWAAWFAVKIASEAMLRVGPDPRAIAAYLTSDRTGFDGHKGRSLRFGPDHRLVQPLYALRRGPDGAESIEEVAQAVPVATSCRTPPATS